MKYLETKEGSLEEAISQAINEKKLDPVGKEDGDIDNDGDKDASDKYLAKRRKAITKAIKKDQKEDLDKEDEKSVKKVIKGLKKAVDAHSGQVKSLTKDIQDETDKNVDETLDKIREANIQKGKSMRSILADIWKMNEGKSPFEKDEGFASDAQRKAAFASGYKAKGKKGKKEETENSSKTATGKKPTKVEIEPEVK